MDDFSSSMEEGHYHRPQRGPLVPVAGAIAEDHHVPDAPRPSPPPPPATLPPAAAAYTGLSEEGPTTRDSFKNQDLFDVVAPYVTQADDIAGQQPSFSCPAASISVQVLRPRDDPNLNLTAVLTDEGSRTRRLRNRPKGAHHLGKENMPTDEGRNPSKGRKSLVWEHMKIDQPSENMATCIHCSKIYTAKSIDGTSHLRRHLAKKCLKRKGLTEDLAKLTSIKRAR